MERRFRKNNYFGDGAATVTAHKQSKLIRAAKYFLSRNSIYAQKHCRFDVISISINQGKTEFNWIKSAFEASPG
jgi:putative endonuclease